ncbi:hypothetical protein AcW1_009874 [Taiwanofungus camphoratus]|nr:hypothetical protein AcV5_003290 [Antrodia cinnamomea]KAI0946402.1 hypothetical protein AcW1_009874 [Antrodia cinnamomea]
MSVSTNATALSGNRHLLNKLLESYGVNSIEELNAKEDVTFWAEKLWGMWSWNYRYWGCSAHVFDMVKPEAPLIKQWDGERRFFFDEETDEVTHEKTYRMPGQDEHKKYAIPKGENLTQEGLACLPEGPRGANLRLAAYAPTGHGTALLKELHWGAPIFGELVLQPDDQIRLSVMAFFSTPAPEAKGTTGQLLQLFVFRDDTTARPLFSQSLHWPETPHVEMVDLASATEIIFPSVGTTKSVAHGFRITPDMTNYARIKVTDSVEFNPDSLAEGGTDARFYALRLHQQWGVVVNIVQLPEPFKPYALKWRLIWRLRDRLMVAVCAYDGETLKQQPEVYEYVYA